MFATLLRKEMREQRRTFRLWILIGVLVVSGMMSPLLAKYTPLLLSAIPGVPPQLAAIIPPPTILDSFTQYIKNITQFGIIVVIVLTMGVMAQEVERGTAAMLLTKPVSRSAVILAKWAAGGIAVIAAVALAALGCAFYTLVLFEPFSLANFLILNGLIVVYLVFYLSLGLLASSLARTQAIAAAIAFGGLILVLIIDAFPVIGDKLPGQLMSWAGSLFTSNPQPTWPALATCLVGITLFLGIAIFRFSRQEI
jgi:ABC-2 type transport system permease protein